jgi:hypothetical protein
MNKPIRIEIYLVFIKGSPTQPGNGLSSFNYSSPSQSESALFDLPSIDLSAIVPMTKFREKNNKSVCVLTFNHLKNIDKNGFENGLPFFGNATLSNGNPEVNMLLV